LVSIGIPVRFERGQTLFDQGDGSRHVFAIQSGAVKVFRREVDGGQAMLTVRALGDVIGDMAALDGKRRSATVTALTTLLARQLTAEQFRRYVDSPGVASAFTTYTIQRLREADQQRTEIALLPVRVRLARCLLRLTTPQGAPVVLLPQFALAQMVGASRNAVVEELAVLRADGVIATGRCAVHITDVAALRERARDW
jgi:CRP-like cAMP-binding protein